MLMNHRRRSTTPKLKTLKLVDTFKQNAGNLLKKSYDSFPRCKGRISRNSGYHVRSSHPSLYILFRQILTQPTDSAFHLTSTATLLVRCALETTDAEVARSCLANVEAFRNILRRVREEEDWDLADMCLDHCERILSRLPETWSNANLSINGSSGPSDNRLVNPATISLPETQTNNDIVDDMMSISGTFGTMDGFPFDMTGIWDMSVFQDVNLP